MKNKFKYIFIIFFVLMIFFTAGAFAHSGRTDSNGGHKDNKNVSGLGPYHYHCGGHEAHLHPNGVCLYSNSSNTSNTYNNSSSTSTNVVKNSNIEAESISITDTFDIEDVEVGDKFKLQASISPYNTTDKTIYWESSNNDILTIDSDGNVNAISKGPVTITAKTVNGKQDSLTLNVNVYPEEIKIEELDGEVFVGDKLQLKVDLVPGNSETTLKWSSSDESIVEVDENGNINALKYGHATITVTTDNMKTDSIVIDVNSSNDSFIGGMIIIFIIALVVIVIKYRKNIFKKSNVTEVDK